MNDNPELQLPDTASTGQLYDRRGFFRASGRALVAAFTPHRTIDYLTSLGREPSGHEFLSLVKNSLPRIHPEPSLAPPVQISFRHRESLPGESDYQDYLNRIIRDVPLNREGESFHSGIGFATLHGPEIKVGVPTASYNIYCAVFRARMDMITPDHLPRRLESLFHTAGLYDLYSQLWQKDAQISQIQESLPYWKYLRDICSVQELHDRLLLPDNSPLLTSPDPQDLLGTPQVMSLGAPWNPMELGKKFLVYSVAPDSNNKFTPVFIGTTMAVDNPTPADQDRLKKLFYTRSPWDTKPLPWVFDAGSQLYNRLPGGIPGGGKPGVLLVSENIYAAYHRNSAPHRNEAVSLPPSRQDQV